MDVCSCLFKNVQLFPYSVVNFPAFLPLAFKLAHIQGYSFIMDLMLIPLFCGAVCAWLLFFSLLLWEEPLRNMPSWLAFAHVSIVIFMLIFLGKLIIETACFSVQVTLAMANRARA